MSPLRLLRKRRVLYVFVLCLFLLGCLVTLKVISSSDEEINPKPKLFSQPEREETVKGRDGTLPLEADHDIQFQDVEDKEIKQDNQIHNEVQTKPLLASNSPYEGPDFSLPEPNYNIHIFYYAWYGNPEHDGKYVHWNHQFLPH